MYLFLHDYTIILCHQWCLSKNQPLVNKIWKESVVFFLFWIDMDSQHYCLLVGFKCVCVRMRGCGCMRVCVHVHPAHAVFWHHSTFTRILFLLSDIVKISCLCTVPCVNHILISSFLSPPPRMKGGGGIGITVSVHPSVCLCVQSCPLSISWTAQSVFYQIWYGDELSRRQFVKQKNWFTILNVKVTARAYIIKIWLFL